MLHISTRLAATALIPLALLSSCTKDPATLASYKYTVEASSIPHVERVLDRIASQHQLTVFRKGRAQMATLTQGADAFFTALYFEGKPLLIVTNVGVGTSLTVIAVEHNGLEAQSIQRIANETTQALEREVLLRRDNSAT